MIRLKQAFGSGIKCKVDAEYMISKYEISLLNGHPLSGLLKIQEEKGNGLNYTGETKVNLTQKLAKGVNHDLLLEYVRQLIRLLGDIRKLGLNTGKMILHTDWIYLNTEENGLNFIYCPLNGPALQYDVRLFLQDIILMASLTGEERTMWKRWLDTNKELTLSSLSMVKASRPIKKDIASPWGEKEVSDPWGRQEISNNNRWPPREEEATLPDGDDSVTMLDLDDDGEAPTGLDEDDFDFLDDDDEAPTGLDDEEEGATTVDDFNYQYGMDKDDGTFVESYSQKSPGPDVSYPIIQRVSTGEEAFITKDEFKLGRSEQRADFVIKNNGGVSNVHAAILKQGRSYYIKDFHSTNGTFLNGNVIPESTPVRLENNSVIELYNEKLIFRM